MPTIRVISNFAVGFRQYRRRCRDGPWCPRLQHARRPNQRHRRRCLVPAACGRATNPRVDRLRPRRPLEDLGTESLTGTRSQWRHTRNHWSGHASARKSQSVPAASTCACLPLTLFRTTDFARQHDIHVRLVGQLLEESDFVTFTLPLARDTAPYWCYRAFPHETDRHSGERGSRSSHRHPGARRAPLKTVRFSEPPSTSPIPSHFRRTIRCVQLRNCIVVPHTASATVQTRESDGGACRAESTGRSPRREATRGSQRGGSRLGLIPRLRRLTRSRQVLVETFAVCVQSVRPAGMTRPVSNAEPARRPGRRSVYFRPMVGATRCSPHPLTSAKLRVAHHVSM